ncbi:MAG: hypothetical protein CMM46_01030 [Rhodospirillaceae bacterium]|nr:hypothetical protein [Rhodospirillaceae bacterium]
MIRLSGRSTALVLVLHMIAFSEAAAQMWTGTLETQETVEVASVVDGGTLALTDGREVRLVRIIAPKLSLGRDWIAEQPLALDAKAALEEPVAGQVVDLHSGPTGMDRHDRILVHVVLPDGHWVQAILLQQELARV